MTTIIYIFCGAFALTVLRGSWCMARESRRIKRQLKRLEEARLYRVNGVLK